MKFSTASALALGATTLWSAADAAPVRPPFNAVARAQILEDFLRAVRARDASTFAAIVSPGARAEKNRRETALTINTFADLASCRRGEGPRPSGDALVMQWECEGPDYAADSMMVVEFKGRLITTITMNQTLYAPPPPPLPPPTITLERAKARGGKVNLVLEAARSGDESSLAGLVAPGTKFFTDGEGDAAKKPLTARLLGELMSGCSRAGKLEVNDESVIVPITCPQPAGLQYWNLEFFFEGDDIKSATVFETLTQPLSIASDG